MTRVPVRDDLTALEGYHSPQVHVSVRLNTNESPFPPPAAWREAFAAELAEVAWHRYPDRAAVALRSRIAEVEGAETPVPIDATNVFAANGSNEVLQSICLAYGGAGRTVATFEPTYALHSHIARVCGSDVVSAAREADFTLDVDVARRLLLDRRPTITFLCSPNNPTGAIYPPEVIHGFYAHAQARGVALVMGRSLPMSSVRSVSFGAVRVPMFSK